MRAARCARASSGGPVDRSGPRPSVAVGIEARCRRHGGGLLGLGLGLLCPVLAGPPGGHLLCGYPIVLAAPLLGELHRVSRTLGECALMDAAPGKCTSAASLAQSATVMRRCAVLGFQASGSSGGVHEPDPWGHLEAAGAACGNDGFLAGSLRRHRCSRPDAGTVGLPDYQSQAMYFDSRYSSMPSWPPSRPSPLCLVPPKGAAGSETSPRLSPTMPLSSASETRRPRPRSLV